jgi:hypothetical protein
MVTKENQRFLLVYKVMNDIVTSNIPSSCEIIDNLTWTRGYFGRLFPEKNLHDK